MRPYELVVVIRADLSQEDLTAQLDQIEGWINTNGGQIVEAKHWGMRRLAYPIRNQRDGYYVLYTINMPPAAPIELERSLRLNENVLRFLIARQES
jgi:small subunit ribosomal protein S6